mgnify:CR=1 FL=1
MDPTLAKTGTEGKDWGGGNQPLKASYGKLMMWFFILSDALTFSAFLAAYGFSRFKFSNEWPIADEVFTHFPFLHGVEAPMYYVALMTFILIFSSVTMVLAVDAGHHMKKDKVVTYMALTILGGFVFVGSQAWEWNTFIKGDYGAVETRGGNILQFVDAEGERVALESFAAGYENVREKQNQNEAIWYEAESDLTEFTIEEVKDGFAESDNLHVRTLVNNEDGKKTILNREASLAKLNEQGKGIVQGANLKHNEYGMPLFADFFFFITGFHGFHVLSGVLLLVIVFFNVLVNTYEKRKSYEMVEKVGLYWHFVDLVWVFVFTFFYLV